jgi:hypothetical protein
MTTKLPAAYRRNLSATCRRVEQSTIELEHLLVRDEPGLKTKKIIHSLAEKKRDRLLTAIRRLRTMNESMFTSLMLDASVTDEEQIINAKIAQLWTILVDSQPQKAKGSGDMPAESAEFIGVHLRKMLEQLDELLPPNAQ